MAGRNDAQFINFFNSKLPTYAGHGDTYHGAYGWRLRREHGTDQLERGFNALKSNPDSRQVVLQIWNASSDLPNEDGTAAAPDIPCNLISMLKVRDGSLEWTQVLRSNDLFLGLPYNIVQFTSLQEIMAGWLGLNVGSYNHLSDSLHVYADSESAITASLPVTLPISNPDSLRLPKYESTRAFEELAAKASSFILSQTTIREILAGLRGTPLTDSYRNILAIISAEIIRRRGSTETSEEAAAECTNPLFIELFNRWRGSLKSAVATRER
jgi:thymidylate synthase